MVTEEPVKRQIPAVWRTNQALGFSFMLNAFHGENFQAVICKSSAEHIPVSPPESALRPRWTFGTDFQFAFYLIAVLKEKRRTQN